jgi:putative transposase
MTRSSFRYQSAPSDDEEELRLALIKLAKRYGRYGYRKIAALLRMEGWAVNHKKVERIWREEGLQLPKRHRKRRRLYHKDSSVIRLRPSYQNHIWSVDFVHDKLSSGRPYKMLTVLDGLASLKWRVSGFSFSSSHILSDLYMRRQNAA